MGTFPNKEVQLYFIAWIGAVIYSIYTFATVSRTYFHNYNDDYDDFEQGWTIWSESKKDKADFEWETIKHYIKTVFPAMAVHICLSEVCRGFLNIEILVSKYFQALFPLCYITWSMGWTVAFLTVIQPIAFYIVFYLTTKKYFIWTLSLLFLLLLNFVKKVVAEKVFLSLNHYDTYLSILLVSWMNLRCTSYCISSTCCKSFVSYLAYCFYFPTIFTGPFISFKDFNLSYSYSNNLRYQTIWNLIRIVVWIAFLELALHFIYVNATAFQIPLIKSLDLCGLCGYGYLMGQFFHIKYLVLYGFSTCVASFEYVKVPALPRCIGRIHLYSDMWKYFDPGLYNFLIKSIYIPCQKNIGFNKLAASFVCFAFIYIWHGTEMYIFIWAMLNFIGITLEGLGKILNRHLKLSSRRVQCLLTAPLLALSALSNFYFFAGKEVGDVFVQKIFTEPLFNLLYLLVILYCCCQVSLQLKNVKSHNM